MNRTLSHMPMTGLKTACFYAEKHDVFVAQEHVQWPGREVRVVEGDSHFVAASSYTRAAINNRRLFKQGEERGRKGERRGDEKTLEEEEEEVVDKENKPKNGRFQTFGNSDENFSRFFRQFLEKN